MSPDGGHARLWERPSALGQVAGVPGVRSGVRRRAIQDVLLPEGLLAVRLSEHVESLDELRQALVGALTQNSQETRLRYSQSVLKWFFADGFNGLARRVSVVDFSVEMRKRVTDQLGTMLPAEFGDVCYGFSLRS